MMCSVNRTMHGDLVAMEAVSGQTGITVSCILQIIQVKKKKILILDVIDIIIFIYSRLFN